MSRASCFDYKTNRFDLEKLKRVRNLEEDALLAELAAIYAKKRPFVQRVSKPRLDPKTSSWWLLYACRLKTSFEDPESRDYVIFRHRFQLPLRRVREIATEIQEDGLHDETNDAFGRSGVPTILLVLGIRILLYA